MAGPVKDNLGIREDVQLGKGLLATSLLDIVLLYCFLAQNGLEGAKCFSIGFRSLDQRSAFLYEQELGVPSNFGERKVEWKRIMSGGSVAY